MMRKKRHVLEISGFDIPKAPPNFYSDTWKTLKDSINCIFSKSPFSVGHEELFQNVRNLVNENFGDQLQKDVKEECEKQILKIKENLEEVLKSKKDSSGSVTFETELSNTWSSFLEQVIDTKKIFLHLDLHNRHRNTTNLENLLFESFKKNLITNNESIKEKTMKSILDHIKRERITNLTNPIQSFSKGELSGSTMKNIVSMMISVGLYEENFELKLIEDTQKFYKDLSNSLGNSLPNGISEYVKIIEDSINLELSFCNQFLTQKSFKKMSHIVYSEMCQKNISLLSEGFSFLIKNNKKNDLKILFSSICHCGVTYSSILINQFEKLCLNLFKKIVLNNEHHENDNFNNNFDNFDNFGENVTFNDDNMISNLINFKYMLEGIIQDSFNSDFLSCEALKRSITVALNERTRAPAQLIAKFMNDLLSKENHPSPPEDFEKKLFDAMAIFRFVESKDVFEESFKEYFVTRMVMKLSNSPENEVNLIKILGVECGSSFAKRLTEMNEEIKKSDSNLKSFKTFIEKKENNINKSNKNEKNKKDEDDVNEKDIEINEKDELKILKDIEFIPVIIKANCWPQSCSDAFKYPSVIKVIQNNFLEYYKSLNDYEKRSLTWISSAETARLVGKFSTFDCEIKCSGHQASVLLCFNNLEESKNFRIDVNTVQSLTGLSEKELKSILKYLTDKKIGIILIRRPENANSEDFLKCSLTVNENFSFPPNGKISLNRNQRKEISQDDKVIEEKALFTRDFVIDCAIIRLMKIKKTSLIAKLINDAIDQVKNKFIPSPQDVKKRIESLIENEYLKRRDRETNTVDYIA